MERSIIRRICQNGLLLALLCAIGMISFPLGDNIKVSLQFLAVLIIFGLTEKLIDKLIIVLCYILLGLFIPVYAGFSYGVSPTFGFILGFFFCAFPSHFLNRLNIKKEWIKLLISSLASLLTVYLCGSIFLSLYLNQSYISSLLISIVPYIGFDLIKIAISVPVIILLNRQLEKIKNKKT